MLNLPYKTSFPKKLNQSRQFTVQARAVWKAVGAPKKHPDGPFSVIFNSTQTQLYEILL